jgi:hypothetical protein
MLRSISIGFVSVMALGVGLASPAGAMGGHMGGHMGGNMGAGAIHGGPSGPGGMMTARSDFSAVRFADHDTGRMRMGGDHDHDRFGDRDHDRDHRDHDRFRFFPAFAFGVDNYDVYEPDCWAFHRVWTRAGWRLRRYWVCD